ncbi:AAA family ATPase [Lactobacillaceae bacterium Melli_B4]
MVNKIIQAVAGAGKTYHITHDVDPNKRYLFVTYTNGNVKNIKKELQSSSLSFDKYLVCTFHKFIGDWMMKPFFLNLKPKFDKFMGFVPLDDDLPKYHPNYISKDKIGHYINYNNKFYLNRLSELVLRQNSNYFTKAYDRISMFVDELVIDEYQDLTGKDFEILIKLIKQKVFHVTLVGDIFQSNVSKSSKKSSSKLGEYNNNCSISDFIKKQFKTKSIDIDTISLSSSRRISNSCAELVSSKLDIKISSEGYNTGNVYFIRNNEGLKKLLDRDIRVLIWNSKIRKNDLDVKYVNWSYSKGDTYEEALVVLTKGAKFISNSSDCELSTSTRNQLYVALTRSKGNLYIVTDEVWKNFHL